MSGDPQQANQGQYLAPSAQRYASSISSASSPATTPTTPTFPPNRDLTPSPVPSTYSAQTQGSSQTQYKVRVNPNQGIRVSSRSRQSSKGPASMGMGGLGYPGTVRGIDPPVNAPPHWQAQHSQPSTYQTPSHSTPPYQSNLPPLSGADLPPRTAYLANTLARSGRAPPISVAPVPMRGSHFITPSGVPPIFVGPPIAHIPPVRVEEAPQRSQPTPAAEPGSGTPGVTRPRSGTSSPYNASRTVNQSQGGMSRTASGGESSNLVDTPRKPSSVASAALVSASSSAGSQRLTSPPPPMPPPRDMPLPPLPPIPSGQSLPLASATSSQSSLSRAGEKRTIPLPEGGDEKHSDLRGLGLGPVAAGPSRDPRMRDVSAPATLNGPPNSMYPSSRTNSGSCDSRDSPVETARKTSSPPLGGLFSKLGARSTTSLNSNGGSSGKVRMTDVPSEFRVLPSGGSQSVDSGPLAGPTTFRTSSYATESSTTSHSLPVMPEKRAASAVGIGRPSTAYYGARRSEEVTRQLLSSDVSKDASKAVQPRKSSGGLKGLFSRSKNKERLVDKISPNTSSSPVPVSAPMTKRRASEDMLRTRKLDLKPTEPLRLPADRAGTEPITTSKPSLSEPRPSPHPMERSTGRSTTPQPISSPPTPTAETVARQRLPMNELQAAQPPIHKLPPSISLHLGDLPQLDLSLGSTFDDLMKALDLGSRKSPQAGKKASPLSPVRPNMHDRRRSRSFSHYSNSSSGQSLLAGESKSNTGKSRSGMESSTSLAADLAAYHSLDVLSPAADIPPSIPASSLFHHDRTLSGASSVSGKSSPTTPIAHEENRVHIYASQSSSSTDPLSNHSLANVSYVQDPAQRGDPPAVPASDKSKPVRPSLLQLAESQRSTTTILEQDEVKLAPVSPKSKSASDLSALGLAPPVEISIPRTVTSSPSMPKKEQIGSRQICLARRSRTVHSQYTALELAAEMRRIIVIFEKASAQKSSEKAGLIRNELLDCLVEGEKKGFDATDERGHMALRAVSIDWSVVTNGCLASCSHSMTIRLNVLLHELEVDQAANERGACLEALSSIMESPSLSTLALENRLDDQAIFRSLMQRIMSYVLEKLSGKGVFHNTLMFAGRMLAFAFFRIEGIALQLLSALPTKQAMLTRFMAAVEQFSSSCSAEVDIAYPAHLQALQMSDVHTYMAMLHKASPPTYDNVEEELAFHFKPGNWLRRWQSDDSELFPAFYKAYHRQLARHLAQALNRSDQDIAPVSSAVLVRAPGYVHLAAIFATKCQSYINGSVNAVTTTSANSSFNADESAGMRGNIKPPVLETANRRLSELILHLASSKLFVPSCSGTVQECDGIQLWANMIDVWIKHLISRTSLYSPKAVFCLFDLLDGIMMPPTPQLMSPDLSQKGALTLIDIPHVISVVRIILTETDHHLTLAKCIAFVWTHFDTLCSRAEDRRALCLQLLLDPVVFERLMLFWSQSVRSYVLRLVVFRLGHLSTSPADFVNHAVEVKVVQHLSASLERIRNRHDELEPKKDEDEGREELEACVHQQPDGHRGLVRSRSTITMVETVDSPPAFEQEPTEAEQLLGLAPSSPVTGKSHIDEPEVIATTKAKAKTSSWFKKPFTKTKKAKKSAFDDSDSDSASSGRPSLEAAVPIQPKSILKPSHVSIKPEETGMSKDQTDGSGSLPQSQHDRPHGPKSPVQKTFEFELPTASPRSDTFDRPTILGSPSRQGSSMPTNPPKLPPSPHMSRSFSKRSSLLHPSAASALEAPVPRGTHDPVLSVLTERPPYDKRLHPYCIRMLAELEDVRREYDEWWAEDGPGRQDNAPPRLNVAWPFSEEED
ncbi:hypothetical protein NliqN6_2147 [Naganishia liquefaciens]|uniref:Uncharacterized protein n=1 Tax=Naganishia liquefaciens TaxID=104408 RepID=A0A8H3TR95_9TREE|nr:hypothetical protein NliqN6_2147 [Naganishia liquefaciens]